MNLATGSRSTVRYTQGASTSSQNPIASEDLMNARSPLRYRLLSESPL